MLLKNALVTLNFEDIILYKFIWAIKFSTTKITSEKIKFTLLQTFFMTDFSVINDFYQEFYLQF